MAIPHVYTAVKPQDFTFTPLVIHKDYVFTRADLYSGSTPKTGSGYQLLEALYFPEKLKLGTQSENTYPTNSFDGSFKYLIWHSINGMYYKVPYDMFATLEHSNPNFVRKQLSPTASIISIAQHDFGEGIKPFTLQITSSQYKMVDDGFGNIILSTSGSYTFTKDVNLVAHWNFNDLFKNPKSKPNTQRQFILSSSMIDYISRTNNLNYNKSFLSAGVFSNLSPIGSLSTYVMLGNSYILTENQPEFNFTKNDNFSIGFNITCDEFPAATASIVSKRGTKKIQELGQFSKPNKNEVDIVGNYYTSSYLNLPTNVYPYDFEIREDVLYFSRSDGVNLVELSASLELGTQQSVWVAKTGSLYNLYLDKVLVNSKTHNRLDHCTNDYSVMIGSLDTVGTNNSGQSICLGDIRIYDTAVNQSDVNYLYEYDLKNVSYDKVVGNVFYKQGFLVITHPNGKYAKDILDNNFTVKFQSTHTTFQYECLVRIKKGDYNITLNPTALQNPHSDLLLSSMTGSLEDGALFPYFTEIGLYNPEGELLVVGKTSQPIQIRDDVNLNVSLIWYS